MNDEGDLCKVLRTTQEYSVLVLEMEPTPGLAGGGGGFTPYMNGPVDRG